MQPEPTDEFADLVGSLQEQAGDDPSLVVRTDEDHEHREQLDLARATVDGLRATLDDLRPLAEELARTEQRALAAEDECEELRIAVASLREELEGAGAAAEAAAQEAAELERAAVETEQLERAETERARLEQELARSRASLGALEVRDSDRAQRATELERRRGVENEVLRALGEILHATADDSKAIDRKALRRAANLLAMQPDDAHGAVEGVRAALLGD